MAAQIPGRDALSVGDMIDAAEEVVPLSAPLSGAQVCAVLSWLVFFGVREFGGVLLLGVDRMGHDVPQ